MGTEMLSIHSLTRFLRDRCTSKEKKTADGKAAGHNTQQDLLAQSATVKPCCPSNKEEVRAPTTDL